MPAEPSAHTSLHQLSTARPFYR